MVSMTSASIQKLMQIQRQKALCGSLNSSGWLQAEAKGQAMIYCTLSTVKLARARLHSLLPGGLYNQALSSEKIRVFL